MKKINSVTDHNQKEVNYIKPTTSAKDQTKEMDFGEMLTSEDVKKRLLLGRSKVYQILRSGKLKSVRIDRQYRVSESALKSYILEHESGDFEPKA